MPTYNYSITDPNDSSTIIAKVIGPDPDGYTHLEWQGKSVNIPPGYLNWFSDRLTEMRQHQLDRDFGKTTLSPRG